MAKNIIDTEAFLAAIKHPVVAQAIASLPVPQAVIDEANAAEAIEIVSQAKEHEAISAITPEALGAPVVTQPEPVNPPNFAKIAEMIVEFVIAHGQTTYSQTMVKNCLEMVYTKNTELGDYQ